MNVFLDSSVILRKLLGEPKPLSEWKRIRAAYASRLLRVEVARVIDRLRLNGQLDDEDVSTLVQEARRLYRSIAEMGLTEPILLRASEAFPTTVGTLDALHLASARTCAASVTGLVFATHDVQLGRAARASGLEVIGLS